MLRVRCVSVIHQTVDVALITESGGSVSDTQVNHDVTNRVQPPALQPGLVDLHADSSIPSYQLPVLNE